MLVMAIEAAKQIADKGRPISGFNVQDVTFRAAICIPSSAQGIETSFHLRPAKNMESKRLWWFDFKVCTLENETWTDNCTGSIQVVYGDKEEELDKGVEVELHESRLRDYAAAMATCKSQMSGEKMYDTLAKSGYGYGPAFQLVRELSLNKPGSSVAALVQNFSSSSGETIHPTTLDCIFQTSIWGAVPSDSEKIPTVVLTHIDRLWVDSQATASQDLKTYSSCEEVSQFIGPATSIVALGDSLHKSLVSVQGLRMNIVSAPDEAGNAGESVDSLCHQIVWKPDLKLLSDVEITQLCKTESACDAEHDSLSNDLDFLIAVRVTEALSQISEEGIQASQPHLKKYHSWLVHRQKQLEEGQLTISVEGWKVLLADPGYVQKVEQRVLGTKQGYLYASVAQHLRKLLSGELDPSTFLKNGEMINEAYHELVSRVFSVTSLIFSNQIRSTNPMASVDWSNISIFSLIVIPK
jgi:hypothetical protein